MIRIWGRANSTNVKKVLWCAEECGLDYQLTELGGKFGGLDDPGFRKLNPLGLVPVIDDDGLIVTESNAIVRYLAAEYGEKDLFPPLARKRARADAWMDWIQTSMMGPLFTLIVGMVRTPPEERDHDAIKAARTRARQLMGQMEELLQRQKFLSGERLGIGDIPAGCASHALISLGIGEDLPAVMDWYRRLCGRPAYRDLVAIPLT
ncbi:MAG TPA: glutathione S-transferase family protein [Sphingomicrobium sp.]|nr:glutathione S-transferase family protein [Sphingomicrobium sp.]